MILTTELLKKFNVCPDGYDAGVALGCLDKDSLVAIELFKNAGHKDYAIWIKQLEQNPYAIEFSGEYEYLKYLVYNPIKHEYLSCLSLDKANEVKANLILENPTYSENDFAIMHEIKSLSGQVFHYKPA